MAWGDGNWRYDEWKYGCGYPGISNSSNVSNSSFENLGNTIVATGVNERLNRANYIAALKEARAEACELQQPSKQGESLADKFYNPIAEDITSFGQMFDAVITGVCEKIDRARELRKFRKEPIQRNTQYFTSATTAISTTGRVH